MSDESGLKDQLEEVIFATLLSYSVDAPRVRLARLIQERILPVIESHVQDQLAELQGIDKACDAANEHVIELQAYLDDAREKIAAIEQYNRALSTAHGEMCEILEERNAQVAELRSFIELEANNTHNLHHRGLGTFDNCTACEHVRQLLVRQLLDPKGSKETI